MPLQTHIRSPLFSAAPIPRLRRARAQEGGTILFFGSFNPSDHRTPASSGPIPLKFFNIAAGVGVPSSDGLSIAFRSVSTDLICWSVSSSSIKFASNSVPLNAQVTDDHHRS